MSANSTPNFFVVLDLLIQAFHLDHEEPDLRGGGPFQHELSGRRLDIKEPRVQQLFRKFGSAVLRSGIFPALRKTLRCDSAGARDEGVAGYLGTAITLPPSVDDLGTTLASRLAWLAEQHEALLSKARSQEVGDGVEPAFALLPVMRFACHHLTFAIAGLVWAEFVPSTDLDGTAPHMTWWMETPPSTPMRDACTAAGLTRGQLVKHLWGTDSGQQRAWDEKTLDNLWNAGPSHPKFDSLQAVAKALCPREPDALSRWRRWYGLRHLARQFAKLWGWGWLNGCLATTFAHARVIAHDLQRSSLSRKQRQTVASVGLWAGWRSQVARLAFGSIAQLEGEDPHPTIRLDYRAIGAGDDSLRIELCLAMARGIDSFLQHLQQRGRSPEEARREALQLVWLSQGPHEPLAHLDPVFAQVSARQQGDWPATEQAARNLVEARPDYVDNHYVLVEALAHQGKFAEAFAVITAARSRFPGDRSLSHAEALTLMIRGDHQRAHTDFETARDVLLSMKPADSEWQLHLLLADCFLALGAWAEALGACKLVAAHNDQCGEARALASICHAKLGKRQPENKAAEHAMHRGERALLDALRQRDAAGELGTASILPVPRWHRLWVQPEPTVPGLFPQG